MHSKIRTTSFSNFNRRYSQVLLKIQIASMVIKVPLCFSERYHKHGPNKWRRLQQVNNEANNKLLAETMRAITYQPYLTCDLNIQLMHVKCFACSQCFLLLWFSQPYMAICTHSTSQRNLFVPTATVACYMQWSIFPPFSWRSCGLRGLILGLRPANERRCYFVTTFLIGWAHA